MLGHQLRTHRKRARARTSDQRHTLPANPRHGFQHPWLHPLCKTATATPTHAQLIDPTPLRQ